MADNDTSPSPELRQATRAAFPFAENCGIDLLEVERGRAVMTMPMKGNGNHVGIMYAGALFTLAEMPGGVVFGSAFDTNRFYPIVGEVQIRYVKPVTTDAFVEAKLSDDEIARITADLESTGKAKFVLELEVTDESGEVVARTSATYLGRSF